MPPSPHPPAPPVAAPAPQLAARRETPREPAPEPTRSISIGERADTDARTVTVASKSVTGFRLPPSTLLHRSEDPSPVKEDELRASAQVLV